MSDQQNLPATAHPFAMLTVSQSSVGQVVNVSFNSGISGERRTIESPHADCYTYDEEGRAPIFAIDQGQVHAQVSATDPECVTDADVRAARGLATAAVRYFETIYRLRSSHGSTGQSTESAPISPGI